MNDIQKEIITPLRKEREDRLAERKENKDYFTYVTVCQTVICVFLFFSFLFISKGTGEMSASLKADYKKLIEWSLENTDAESVMKAVNSFLKEPVNLMPAFSPSEEMKTEAFKEETEEGTTEGVLFEETTEETTVKEREEEETEENTTEAEEDETEEKEEAQIKKLSVKSASASTEAVFPVDSRNYTSYFGERVSPITGEDSFHTGLDIAAPMGSDVRSSYSGKVKKTGEDSRNGKYIVVKHSDKLETVYCHLSEILTKKGRKVLSGQVIGKVGSTGWSTGPHLHFEIRKNGKSIDPLSVFKNDI